MRLEAERHVSECSVVVEVRDCEAVSLLNSLEVQGFVGVFFLQRRCLVAAVCLDDDSFLY